MPVLVSQALCGVRVRGPHSAASSFHLPLLGLLRSLWHGHSWAVGHPNNGSADGFLTHFNPPSKPRLDLISASLQMEELRHLVVDSLPHIMESINKEQGFGPKHLVPSPHDQPPPTLPSFVLLDPL